ncbi:MAG: hypothetical protein AMXMBFR58_38030 [Phycisphaerae bacterium]
MVARADQPARAPARDRVSRQFGYPRNTCVPALPDDTPALPHGSRLRIGLSAAFCHLFESLILQHGDAHRLAQATVPFHLAHTLGTSFPGTAKLLTVPAHMCRVISGFRQPAPEPPAS